MADRSVFEKLAETLPEKERKELLTKITRSMDFGGTSEETIYHKEMTNDEREILMNQDFEGLSLFGRFVLWLRSLVSGKNRRDLLIASKIHALKARINQKCPGLTGFETRDLTPKMAEIFFELYQLTAPVRAVYLSLLMKSQEIDGAFVPLLEQGYPTTRVTFDEVVPMASLEAVYDEKGAEQAVKREALDRLDQYIAGLDPGIFSSVEETIIPVFYLKDVVSFPYAAFFDLFHVQLRAIVPGQKPAFQSASAMLTIEYLEKMYFAVYAALKVRTPYEVKAEVVRYLLAISGSPSRPEPVEITDQEPEGTNGAAPERAQPLEPPERHGPARGASVQASPRAEGVEADATALIHALKALHEGVRRFEHRMPLVELIRYFLRDPYYKLYVYFPRLQLREYYQGVLKVRFIAELEQRWASIKSRVVETKIERLFKSERLVEFQNYREYQGTDYEKMGLPFFSHTRSLNIIYNFIRWYYRGYVQELVKILGTIILTQNRVTRNKLLLHATAVEDLEEKIREFDASLSQDSEEGKLFHRLRATLAGDTGLQRMYRTIVLQKDVQVNGLIERAREALAGLQRVFEEVV
ncbi:MAG TPA: DUF5312 family protein, partial [Spirochaetia bacterium]|nr:DUF5312 family protein [Spirochaetia bacterium]